VDVSVAPFPLTVQVRLQALAGSVTMVPLAEPATMRRTPVSGVLCVSGGQLSASVAETVQLPSQADTSVLLELEPQPTSATVTTHANIALTRTSPKGPKVAALEGEFLTPRRREPLEMKGAPTAG
jgi:hypothetical protein